MGEVAAVNLCVELVVVPVVEVVAAGPGPPPVLWRAQQWKSQSEVGDPRCYIIKKILKFKIQNLTLFTNRRQNIFHEIDLFYHFTKFLWNKGINQFHIKFCLRFLNSARFWHSLFHEIEFTSFWPGLFQIFWPTSCSCSQGRHLPFNIGGCSVHFVV